MVGEGWSLSDGNQKKKKKTIFNNGILWWGKWHSTIRGESVGGVWRRGDKRRGDGGGERGGAQQVEDEL